MVFSDDELLTALQFGSERFESDIIRVKYIELGKKLNVSDVAVRKRIRKLRDIGVIKKFTIEIDQRKLGFDITAFIGFDVGAESYISIIEKLKGWKQVQSIFQTSLDHDFLMECWFRNNDDLTVFINKLENLPGVIRVCPATVIQRIK
ncbi:MAG: Lrp/AsnC family transcriptional regulator [Candidatus Thorarchaeota archaeon]